jgi:hypothetical protein
MAFRGEYWSCSKFADKIWKLSGADPKPSSETSKGWREWREDRKTNHPIAYWIVEEGLGMAQDFINWPMDKYNDFRHWFRQRYIKQTHMVPTYLPKGEYVEFDTRLLHAVFGMLRDFVETDMAYDQLSWGSFTVEDGDVPAPTNEPWWVKSRLTHWGVLRSRELGMKRCEWHISLATRAEDPNVRQAAMGQEIKDLYLWWMDVRPNRKEPGDISGSNKMFEGDNWDRIFDDDAETQPSRTDYHAAIMLDAELEKKYKQEDEDMLIRVIKLRESLWT